MGRRQRTLRLRAYRPAVGRAAVLVLLPLVAVAFLARTVAVVLMRRRWPKAAAGVERWWLWLPLAVVLIVLTLANPLIGVPMTALVVVLLTRASSVGSPFRPR
jgi:hypothetical protein